MMLAHCSLTVIKPDYIFMFSAYIIINNSYIYGRSYTRPDLHESCSGIWPVVLYMYAMRVQPFEDRKPLNGYFGKQ